MDLLWTLAVIPAHFVAVGPGGFALFGLFRTYSFGCGDHRGLDPRYSGSSPGITAMGHLSGGICRRP